MGVIAHETAETQMRRVGLNQADHRIELVRVAEAAPVQAHVQFDIDVQTPVEGLGQLQVP